jgi:hypothetical protein
LGPLSAPESVQTEVLRKARQDERFKAAAAIWPKLTPIWMQILSDNQTPEFAAVVHRITHQPIAARLKQSKDLAETMVIAHAIVAAEAGAVVTVLIDDGQGRTPPPQRSTGSDGCKPAAKPSGRSLRSARSRSWSGSSQTSHPGQGRHAQYLHTAARARRQLDGLPPIETIGLLSPDLWS